MFSKLLKYDFKSIKKFGVPICIIALILGVVGAVDAYFSFGALIGELFKDSESVAAVLLSSIGLLAFFFIVFALLLCSTVVQIIVYVNYYKTLCTDEGYLTFTLPVKQKDILLSKSLNALIWGAIIGAVILVCAAFIGLGIYLGVESVVPSSPPQPDDSLYPTEGLFSFWTVGLLLLTGLLYTLNNTQLIFMVIFFASVISKKNKGLVAIGLVLAANMAYSMLSSLVSSIFSIISIASTTNITNIQLIIYSVFLAGSGVAYFFTTKRMMERKLNLP